MRPRGGDSLHEPAQIIRGDRRADHGQPVSGTRARPRADCCDGGRGGGGRLQYRHPVSQSVAADFCRGGLCDRLCPALFARIEQQRTGRGRPAGLRGHGRAGVWHHPPDPGGTIGHALADGADFAGLCRRSRKIQARRDPDPDHHALSAGHGDCGAVFGRSQRPGAVYCGGRGAIAAQSRGAGLCLATENRGGRGFLRQLGGNGRRRGAGRGALLGGTPGRRAHSHSASETDAGGTAHSAARSTRRIGCICNPGQYSGFLVVCELCRRGSHLACDGRPALSIAAGHCRGGDRGGAAAAPVHEPEDEGCGARPGPDG